MNACGKVTKTTTGMAKKTRRISHPDEIRYENQHPLYLNQHESPAIRPE
jgi:hypothetical protein